MDPTKPDATTIPRWLAFLLIFGLYLSIRGYQSREGDQAYRLPLLLHRQDPAVFADDPFVRAFDAFNPHRGSLALLDAASRAVGLSAALAVLFAITFAATCRGLDVMARAAWPDAGPGVGVVAVVLVLLARAGNVGTNHLFEPILLDRLIGFGLGWLALGSAVADPGRRWWVGPVAIGLAALVHPSVGLQLAMLSGASWVVFGLVPSRTGVDRGTAIRAVAATMLAFAPALAMNAGQGAHLFRGLGPDEFRLLSVELQGPQHMLPHLWRLPQWLAWGCFPVLAMVSLVGDGRSESCPRWPRARVRLAVMLAIILAGLGLAWVAVEVVRDIRVTIFQPFRMATILRGLALAALSGRVLSHWRRGDWIGRARALMLAVGLDGDWSLVVATTFEVALTALDAARSRRLSERSFGRLRWVVGAAVLGLGLGFLSRHDTESGHIPLIGALAAATLGSVLNRKDRPIRWDRRRMAWAIAGAWAVPASAIIAGLAFDGDRPWVRALVGRCRFAAVPRDDIERLAVWCRDHTPETARFVGPPGPKTFRLWSMRSLAFNRAGSPYHAEGLADWSARFRDHVGFSGSSATFVAAYLADRHGLEHRYQNLSADALADLADRQDATHVIAAPTLETGPRGPLERLHVEGKYAVYQVLERDRISHGGAQRKMRKK